jgi:PAS domain S-box-containing protein
MTAALLAILGIDVGATIWSPNLTAESAPPLVLAAAVILLGLLAVGLYRSQRNIHAQKAALKESEESHRSQFANSSSVMLLIDPADGSIQDANTAAVKFYGYSRNQLLGLHITDLNSMPTTEVRDAMRSVPPHQGKRFEFQHRLADGTIRDVDVSSSHIQVGTRSILHSIIFDITPRKQAEATLRESEAFQHLLLNTIPIPVFYKDREGRYLGFNKAFETLFGARKEALIGKNVFDIHPPELAEIYHAKDAELLKNGGIQTFESQVQDLTGKPHDIIFYKACLTTPEGEVRGLIGTLIDITEQKQAEVKTRKLLEESRQASEALLSILEDQQQAEGDARRLATAIEQADETIVITDAQGRIEYVNPAFEAVTGYTREEALGQNPRILQSGQHDAVFYHALWETLVIGETWRGRLINRHKDGTVYTEEAVISPVLDDARHITHYVAVKRDITEHMRLSEQIQQSQKMDSIGRLAGGVAHDFNNMLTVILGHAQMALDQADLAAPIRKRLEEIRKAASRSADLTQQLLAFARKQAIAPRMLNLNETVKGTLKMLQRLIGEDIQLEWVPQDPPGTVEMDPSQINQILANLCVNARDAITGGGTLTIETHVASLDAAYCDTHPTALPGEFVCLSVRDTGCGMDPATLTQVFEPFFTTKGLGEGTGLGLSTVYGIIQQNKGFIEVESTPGQGSEFQIYLPRCDADATRTPVELPAPRGTETILIAEDDPAMLNATAQMLESVGYTVRTAQTPDAALKIVREDPAAIHLLLSDVVMPGMNGWELSQAVLEKAPGLPCLYMSGYTADVIAQNGILEEGIDFIQKPFSKNLLARKVREVLDA